MVSEQQDPVTEPDTVMIIMRVNLACLLEKSPRAVAPAQLSPGWHKGHHKGRIQLRGKETEHRFTPTTVDISSIPQQAEAVVFVQSLWDTCATILAWLGVTRV